MRTPVVEDLQPASFDVRLLDVNPIVFHQMLVVFLYLHLLEEESHGNEIAVLQRVAHFANVRRNGNVEGMDKFFNWHGGEEIIALETPLLTGCIDPADAQYLVPSAVNARDTEICDDLTTHGLYFSRHGFPHLSWAVLGIKELLDQRSLGFFLRDVSLSPRL